MKKLNNCIFCEKGHESKECYHAKKLDFEQKQEILKNKRCCFTCLKFGHQSKVCKSNVQCLLCNKRHWALMCPELPSNKMRVKTPDLEEKRDVTLSNHCAAEEVLLQTLQVNIKAGGKTRRIRALIDSGSQLSYLLKKTAHEMNLKSIEMKNIIHSVFGGSTLQKQDHRVYEITLQNVTIPRCVKINRCTEGINQHTFCDASKTAYSTVVFLRKTSGENIEFFLFKQKVESLKDITIPRLELLACCIGARLTSSIRKAMNLEDIPSLYWTDSSTALYWIQHEDHWGTFVNNRVGGIRNLSSKEASKHLPGTCNPADLPSRGCSVQGFLKSRWWEGPQWLKLPEEDWPVTVSQCNLEEILKERKKGHCFVNQLRKPG
ncbi:pro-Pol polyprotein [Trichonephila inaurata madagascariensis]|uniref:Pro-Pol polyprotein n=1 Tax=Trichonephila inaurata madagascariensis TaxID=2747483 RepID=A0A8X6XU69_9ARAC|nr:pro-Pol polyprotein [Trichonephila inaurata madagascariensis]